MESHPHRSGFPLHRVLGRASESGERNHESEPGWLMAMCHGQDRLHSLRNPVQNKNPGSLFRNYSEFQYSDSRAVNQEGGSSEHMAICTCHTPMKPALIMEQIQNDRVMGKQSFCFQARVETKDKVPRKMKGGHSERKG